MRPDLPRCAPARLVITDPDAATTLFQRPFPGIRLDADADGRAFRLEHDRATDGRLTVNRLRLTGSAHGTGSVADVVGVARVLSGRFGLAYDGAAIDTTSPYLRPSGRSEFRLQDTELELLEIDRAAFSAAAEEHLRGSGMTARLPTPDTAGPLDARQAARWHRVADLASAVAFDGAGLESPLIRTALFDLLVAALLDTFPLAQQERGSAERPAGSAAVRRAIAFIEDRVAEPLDSVAIARAAGVSVRSLQSAFRRDLDSGVMSYVRSRRLAGARRDLLEADLDVAVTVQDIARRWGFVHLSRFAQQYRAVYRENPSQTLRR